MIGIVIQLLLSYVLARWLLKESLSFMGWKPSFHQLKLSVFFLLLAAFCSSLTFFLRMYFGKEAWELNPQFNLLLLAKGSWYQLKSVLYEELIFRGVLFYLLIKKLGNKKALLISAAAFGIYHWFTYEVFNNLPSMALIFLITSSAGLVYGLGYQKTGTLLVPIAMHFGWNFINAVVFSNSNTGPGLLIEKLPPPQVQVSWLVYGVVVYMHLVLFVGINWFILRKQRNIL